MAYERMAIQLNFQELKIFDMRKDFGHVELLLGNDRKTNN
jgi:hypothetical protein